MAEPLRVLLLHDSDREADAISAELRRAGVAHAYQRVDTRDDFLVTLRHCMPHVVIADAEVAHYASLDALRDLQRVRPAAGFILLAGGVDESVVVEAMRAGADDVIGKSHLARLPAAIAAATAVHRELDKLSARQLEVLRLIAAGLTTPQIAKRLRLSPKTIETHRTALMRRLDVHDVVRLVHFAVRVGLR